MIAQKINCKNNCSITFCASFGDSFSEINLSQRKRARQNISCLKTVVRNGKRAITN